LGLYEPLKFIEQIKNYNVSPNEKLIKSDDINSHALAFTEELFKDEVLLSHFFHDFVYLHRQLDNGESIPKDEKYDIWRKLKLDFEKSGYQFDDKYKLRYDESDVDFFNQLMMSYIYYDWRWHKYTYKVAPYLGKQLAGMDFPSNALLSCFLKIPAKTFYIDLSNVDTDIVEDLCGMFVTTQRYGDKLLIETTALVYGVTNRLLPIFLQSRIELGEAFNDNSRLKFIGDSEGGSPKQYLTYEDGKKRTFDTDKSLAFLANFLVYLQASNKDVEEAQMSKNNFSKDIDKSKEPKNKFGELRQYEVGYRISTPVTNKKKNCKNYEYENEVSDVHGSPKSPHYRSAHWHHFWTGSNDDKKLIIKWVEGVFVNGKAEQEVAVVHNVQ